jgi:hypothetical protein
LQPFRQQPGKNGRHVLNNDHRNRNIGRQGRQEFRQRIRPAGGHADRRLMQRDTLDTIVNRLQPGGLFYLATDIIEYAEMSAELLAEELERFCRGEPILARRSTSLERVVKWTRRKPALAGSLAATAIAVLNGAAIVRTHDVGATRKAITSLR